jgi:hypothetical protein
MSQKLLSHFLSRPLAVSSARDLRSAYRDGIRNGIRNFNGAVLDGEKLSGLDLSGTIFWNASFVGADLSGSCLEDAQFTDADFTGARLERALLTSSDLIGTNLTRARLQGVHFTGANLHEAVCHGAHFQHAWFQRTILSRAEFTGAKLSGSIFDATQLGDFDVSPFCSLRSLHHQNPSYIDWRTVIRSYTDPHLKRFLTDCGTPDLFADYMIDCARALETLTVAGLLQSTFISYGGPDEAFARRLYHSLRAHGIAVFFFPETGKLGERIDTEVYARIQQHDRILLVCSRKSLGRPGVIAEIRETLDREARDGGASYLLPISLDGYVFSGWKKEHPELA